MNKNIRDLVLDAMNTDDSFNEGNSRNIIKLYTSATIGEKELIDNLFINLCGFSLQNLIRINSKVEGAIFTTGISRQISHEMNI